jgi:thiosulfate dehydrogenase [quinone] large subunit
MENYILKTRQTGYLMLRVTMGINMLIHGLVRFGSNYKPFVEGMVGRFRETILPEALVTGFAYSVPVTEFIIGTLLVLGLFTRLGLGLGALLMVVFVFGQCLIQNWQTAHFIMIYSLIYFTLFFFIEYNTFSADNFIRKDKKLN